MADAANTSKTNDCLIIRRKIGKTTYVVRVHFNETAREMMEDKIKCMLHEEVRKM